VAWNIDAGWPERKRVRARQRGESPRRVGHSSLRFGRCLRPAPGTAGSRWPGSADGRRACGSPRSCRRAPNG